MQNNPACTIWIVKVIFCYQPFNFCMSLNRMFYLDVELNKKECQ